MSGDADDGDVLLALDLNTDEGMSAEEIADVTGFLAGEGGRWVTGQVIRVNGGMA